MSSVKMVCIDMETGEHILKPITNNNGGGGPTNNTLTHIQTTPASVWSINHNKQTINFVAQVYIDGELIQPNGISIVDTNNIDITFTSTLAGRANIIFWN